MSVRNTQPLPAGWAPSALQSVADINPTLDKSAYPDTLSVSFVPMPAMEAATGIVDVSKTRPFADVKRGFTPFLEGDVLFAKITPCMENGKMAVAPSLIGGLGFGSTEFHVLRPSPGMDARFIYYWVSSQSFRREAEHNMTGAVGQRRVPTTYIAEHPIPVAPTHEQRRIVAKIEELFSELDKGVEALTTAREQLRVYRQSLLKHAFEGRLTEEWRSRNPERLETSDALRARLEQTREGAHQTRLSRWQAALKQWAEQGTAAPKPPKPRDPKPVTGMSGDEANDLPQLPNGWLWERLGWMTLGVEYGTAAKSASSGKVAVIRMGNIQNAKIDWTNLVYTSNEDEIAAYALNPGDVLFNRTNSPELVGKTAIYRGERPALFAGYLIRVNHNPDVVDGQYLNLFLNSHVARTHGNDVKTDGVNQSNISGEKLGQYPFPYCSIHEQREVVRILDHRLSLVDQTEGQIEEELRRAEALRQAILARAFSGGLVPQDASEEPASVLLERIKAEREAAEGKPKPIRKKRTSAA